MRDQIESQTTCFVCGPAHPEGLCLRFHTEQPGIVTAEWVPERRWEGFRGIIHGGIVATVLDEAMSKAVASTGTPGLTCQLEVRLRRSVVPGEALKLRAWVVEVRKRRVRVAAEIRTVADVEKAHATATFLVPHNGAPVDP